MNNKIELLVHSTPEAGFNTGRTGRVLEGLISTEEYGKNIERTILVGPFERAIDIEKIQKEVNIKYSSFDGICLLENKKLADRFAFIEEDFNVSLIYGFREFDGNKAEVILVDASCISLDKINLYKRELYEKFGIPSDKYEHIYEYEYFIKPAEASFLFLEALVEDKNWKDKIMIAHDFMGVPLIFSSYIFDADYKTVFYAYDVPAVKTVVENHPGHDIMFYNMLERAIKEDKTFKDIFGYEEHFRHVLMSKSFMFDQILAVSDNVAKELAFLGKEFFESDIRVVYNGIPSEKITFNARKKARNRLRKYAKNLVDFKPDFIFARTFGPVIDKGFWRDLKVLEKLDILLGDMKRKAVLFCLSRINSCGKEIEEIVQMEKDYNWPVYHKKNYNDLAGKEIDFYTSIQEFNHHSENIKIVFFNQTGWGGERFGKKMPKDMKSGDIYMGPDLIFGQSVYEPFGISHLMSLTYGAISVLSSSCGCVRFASAVKNGRKITNLFEVADYTAPFKHYDDFRDIVSLSQEDRDSIEDKNSSKVAENIAGKLPQNDVCRKKKFGRRV